MNALEQLLAIEAIKVLKARYFRLVDTKDWPGIGALFAPDAQFTRTGALHVRDPWSGAYEPPLPAQPDVRTGRAEIIAMMRAAVEQLRTVHHGFTPEIEILSPVSARGIWAMEDEIRDRDYRLVLHGFGHYHETYEKSDAGWMIKTARISRMQLLLGGSQGQPERYVSS
jgi:hypothetical protein